MKSWGDNIWSDDVWSGQKRQVLGNDQVPSTGGSHLAFPLRFSEDADVSKVNLSQSIKDDLKSSIFVRRDSIPMFSFGVGIEDFLFDPIDDATEIYLADRISVSLEEGEIPAVIQEENIVFNDSRLNRENNKLSIAIPYSNAKTNQPEMLLIETSVPKVDL